MVFLEAARECMVGASPIFLLAAFFPSHLKSSPRRATKARSAFAPTPRQDQGRRFWLRHGGKGRMRLTDDCEATLQPARTHLYQMWGLS
ncbi:hypothetical protein CPB83DRAFT_852471 [Crepidotus variabilis]|uniref:Uncharacterized protein n=1 Tax=Crepidotus variabilis TaxID=179855 RepID=A0A9P6JRK2_9AGAR|nr:hypothetical protein CPB83DRAFT_852471 [Crepidotus variabilis]